MAAVQLEESSANEANNAAAEAKGGEILKKKRIQRFMQQYEEVELSALGMAIATVVTVVEILKNNGLAVEKKISTSTVDVGDETKGRSVQKAKRLCCLGCRRAGMNQGILQGAGCHRVAYGNSSWKIRAV